MLPTFYPVTETSGYIDAIKEQESETSVSDQAQEVSVSPPAVECEPQSERKMERNDGTKERESTGNKRLSYRLYPSEEHRESSYPRAARAPQGDSLEFISSADSGWKTYMGSFNKHT